MKKIKRILIAILLIIISVLGYGAWILLGSKTSNPNNYKTKCTAEPTLLCTFSPISLFGILLFCIFAYRNLNLYA